MTAPAEKLAQALGHAREWIGKSAHGDNCFLHDEGEFARCYCGKDSLVDHLQSVLDALSKQEGA